jgi:hypothetical protein
MSDGDEKLRALFALDEPSARDPAFSAEVMAEILRREFRQDVAIVAGASLLGAAGLWAAWPVLHPAVVAVSQGLAPAAAALVLAACAVAILSGRTAAAGIMSKVS